MPKLSEPLKNRPLVLHKGPPMPPEMSELFTACAPMPGLKPLGVMAGPENKRQSMSVVYELPTGEKIECHFELAGSKFIVPAA